MQIDYSWYRNSLSTHRAHLIRLKIFPRLPITSSHCANDAPSPDKVPNLCKCLRHAYKSDELWTTKRASPLLSPHKPLWHNVQHVKQQHKHNTLTCLGYSPALAYFRLPNFPLVGWVGGLFGYNGWNIYIPYKSHITYHFVTYHRNSSKKKCKTSCWRRKSLSRRVAVSRVFSMTFLQIFPWIRPWVERFL